jgi:putative ABC transport system permease protein
MLIVKIAIRNIFRNTRRSMTTLATIAIGAIAVLVFGAYVTYIELGVQTGAVQQNGHLQVFSNGYYTYGTGAPAAWGIADYPSVIRLIRDDPVLQPLVAVATPIQAVAGIAGNFKNDTSKTFFGVGFVPSDRDRMKVWNEYRIGMRAVTRSGMADDEPSKGVTGLGLVRILGLCAEMHLDGCPPPRQAPRRAEIAADKLAPPSVDLTELAGRDQPAGKPEAAAAPTIDLLAATAGGAPNVVSLQIARVDAQSFKEADDNYVGMNLSLAQDLIYGRGEHRVSGIVLQLHRSEDLAAARTALRSLFARHQLDLEIRDFVELTPQYTQIINLFESIFSFIATIIGIVVLFTVSNAMGMSVVERTDEIGTTRAMGVRRAGIRRQFLVEGSLLGVIGATAGVILAFVVAYAINHAGLTWTPPGATTAVPLRLYIEGAWRLGGGTWAGLVLAAAVAAFVPAHRAARMPVVDALRHV